MTYRRTARSPLAKGNPRASRWTVWASVLLTVIVGAVNSAQVRAQQAATTAPVRAVSGSLDNDIPLPLAPHKTPQIDSSALQELKAYQTAIGDDTWTDLQGKGTIAYTRSQGAVTGDATLYLKGELNYRLDTSVEGVRASVRVGTAGTSSQHDGRATHAISLREAEAGLVAFSHLRQSSLAKANISVIDRGLVSTSLGTLHRITYEHPMSFVGDADQSKNNINPAKVIVTDLYLDPTTHRLMKSCYQLKSTGSAQDDIQIVTTYANYQQSGNTLIPWTISQTVNGQQLWVLTLSSVQLSTGLADEIFVQQ